MLVRKQGSSENTKDPFYHYLQTKLENFILSSHCLSLFSTQNTKTAHSSILSSTLLGTPHILEISTSSLNISEISVLYSRQLEGSQFFQFYFVRNFPNFKTFLTDSARLYKCFKFSLHFNFYNVLDTFKQTWSSLESTTFERSRGAGLQPFPCCQKKINWPLLFILEMTFRLNYRNRRKF